jgi:translation elongation factor EF-G
VFLLASLRLAELIYRVDITGAQGTLNVVYSVLGQRSGTFVDTSSTSMSNTIHASSPVRCAGGIADELRLATQGHAHCSCLQLVPENEENSIVIKTRKAKNMPAAEALESQLVR